MNRRAGFWLFVFVVTLFPFLAEANSGDFSGGVAIGTSYAGVDTAPTNGVIVQGAVGIGTTSPGYPIDVVGALRSQTTAGTGGDTFVSAEAGAISTSNVKWSFSERSNNTDFWLYSFDGTNFQNWAEFNYSNNALAFMFGGNIGIGNTSPSHLLHVGSSSASGIVMELQNSSGACTHNPGASSETVSCTSDASLKSDIEDTTGGLAWLDDMHIRDFTVKATGEQKTGVIAQELMQTHPDMVHENENGLYSVDQPNPWVLVKAIQDLHGMISAQQDEIAELKSKPSRSQTPNTGGQTTMANKTTTLLLFSLFVALFRVSRLCTIELLRQFIEWQCRRWHDLSARCSRCSERRYLSFRAWRTGVRYQQTLTASANNDALTALYINPYVHQWLLHWRCQ